MLTLIQVAENPQIVTQTLKTRDGEPFVVRPLTGEDVDKLTLFLQKLSSDTRRLSSFPSYDRVTALELCSAIARYDKLRFVVEFDAHIIAGLLEFSFDLVQGDIDRYASYKIQLDPETDCRWGLALADDYQSQGIGSLAMPLMKDVARQFGQHRIILLGGVLADNERAIHYYDKHGFKQYGTFINSDGMERLDMMLVL